MLDKEIIPKAEAKMQHMLAERGGVREITVFDLVKHLELDNFCDLIFGAVNDIGTQEGLKAALQTEITKEELQRINAAALREADEFRSMCRPIISYYESLRLSQHGWPCGPPDGRLSMM